MAGWPVMAFFACTPPEAAGLAGTLLRGAPGPHAPEVAIGRDDLMATPVDEGWGNDNWRIDGPGGPWLLKLSPASYGPKWAASHRAMALAAAAGVPVPTLVHLLVEGPMAARLLTWVDGEPAAAVVGDPARTDRFVASLGTALRALHGIRADGFSSRLDGSGPRFASWAAYLAHRLDQVTDRCRAAGAPEPDTVVQAARAVTALAARIDGDAVPTLCHRDLHLANLLVDAAGTLCGVLDWDGAEAWDAAGDVFKLEWLVAPALGVDPDRLEVAEHGPAPAGRPHRWAERKLAVQLIEALNVIPNALIQGWAPAFGRSAGDHLARLLERV